MSQQEDREKIKDRIRKLLNLAGNEGAMQGEIDNALRFAAQLKLKHNIADSELKKPDEKPKTARERARDDYAYCKMHSTSYRSDSAMMWEHRLAHAVCNLIGTVTYYYQTQTITMRKGKDGTIVTDKDGKPYIGVEFTFFGPEEDATDAVEIFNEWQFLIAAMAKMKFRIVVRGMGRSYCEGFTFALGQKVTEAKEEAKRLMAASTSRALVVQGLDLEQAKKDEGQRRYGKPKETRRKARSVDLDAFRHGRQDGEKADFTRERRLKIDVEDAG